MVNSELVAVAGWIISLLTVNDSLVGSRCLQNRRKYARDLAVLLTHYEITEGREAGKELASGLQLAEKLILS
jgi:hypothetical protein